jgi:hypothetical protein
MRKKNKPLTLALMLHVLVKQSGQRPTHKGEWKEFWQKSPHTSPKSNQLRQHFICKACFF